MHYYNYFGNIKVLTTENFDNKGKGCIRNYFKQSQHAILQLHRLIDTKKYGGYLRICGFVIDRKTLGFYLQCLNYQTFCFISKTKMEKPELCKNLYFLCLLYQYQRAKNIPGFYGQIYNKEIPMYSCPVYSYYARRRLIRNMRICNECEEELKYWK